MKESSTLTRFKTLEEFGRVVEAMDDYRLLPIEAMYADRKIHSARVFGMTNITKNRVTMACGPKYPVFGHREALGYVYRDLSKRGCDVHGEIHTVNDTSWARILFDGIAVKDETDKLVEMGMEFINPMDKKTKFKGHAYTWRQICSNGAGHRHNFPGLEINESHTVNMEIVVPPMINDFVERSLKQTTHMQKMIDDSVKAKVSFDTRQQMTATLTGIFAGISERHVRAISGGIDSLEPTRWQMFNAANYYTSHHNVSPVVREEIDARAEMLINTAYPIVPAVVIPRSDNSGAT
jgi:hypothetical protein